jgi:hypothetical protein
VPLRSTNSLDSRAVDDSAVRTAHHGSTKATGWISFAQHPDFPRDQRKVVTIEGTSGKKQDTELILLTFIFPESEQSPLHGRRCCHVFTVCWRDMAEMHKIVGYRARL